MFDYQPNEPLDCVLVRSGQDADGRQSRHRARRATGGDSLDRPETPCVTGRSSKLGLGLVDHLPPLFTVPLFLADLLDILCP